MSTQITLTLPEDVYERAELLARRTGRPVEDLLAEAIELSFRPFEVDDADGTRPASELTDEDLLAAIDAGLDPEDDQRLSELLDRQQAGLLSEADRGDLTVLMHLYQRGLLRKAEAVREAVRRGLRESA